MKHNEASKLVLSPDKYHKADLLDVRFNFYYYIFSEL